MSYEIVLQEVSSRTLAVACAQVTAGTLQSTIGRRFDEVYQYLEVSGSIQHGLNVIVYWDEPDHRLLFNQQGVRIEAGVEITAEVRKSGDIYGSATPAGLIALSMQAPITSCQRPMRRFDPGVPNMAERYAVLTGKSMGTGAMISRNSAQRCATSSNEPTPLVPPEGVPRNRTAGLEPPM